MARRMRRCVSLLVTAAVLSVAPARALAGPWTPEPGHGYAKVWLKWLYGIGYHAGDGQTYDYGAYNELFLSGYGEVGVAPSFGLWLHAPVLQTFTLEDPRTGESETHVYPGDSTFGARWRFAKIDRFVGALEASIKPPLAPARPVQVVYGTDAGNPEIGRLRVGSGVWDVGATLLLGYAWDRVYTSASIGYLLRTDGYDDVLTWTAEIGAQLGTRWSGRLRIGGVHPIVREDLARSESPSGIGNGTRYTSIALEGEYMLVDRWYLGLTLEGGLFAVARQTGGLPVSIFVAMRF